MRKEIDFLSHETLAHPTWVTRQGTVVFFDGLITSWIPGRRHDARWRNYQAASERGGNNLKELSGQSQSHNLALTVFL